MKLQKFIKDGNRLGAMVALSLIGCLPALIQREQVPASCAA